MPAVARFPGPSTFARRLAAWLLGAALVGCAAPAPVQLSSRDPRYSSPECVEARHMASTFKEQKFSWSAGAFGGPYGLGMVLAGKDHQRKLRRMLARDVHLACSSLPLPRELQGLPGGRPATG